MSEGKPPAPLVAALRDLVTWLQAEGVPGIVIGGVAASILGRPRTTGDIDALVLLDEARWGRFLSAGIRFGFVARRPDAIAFAQQTRVLLARHEPSAIDVDLVLGTLAFERQAIARARSVLVEGLTLPLPTAEDFTIMKAVAHRPHDLSDIESVLDAHPALNVRRVRRWVREFSAAMEMPDVLTDLEAILARRKGRAKRSPHK